MKCPRKLTPSCEKAHFSQLSDNPVSLKQKQLCGSWRPVAYISRAMNDTEQHYVQIEKEVLALSWAFKWFADYLVGLRFHFESDHKSLVPLLGLTF